MGTKNGMVKGNSKRSKGDSTVWRVFILAVAGCAFVAILTCSDVFSAQKRVRKKSSNQEEFFHEQRHEEPWNDNNDDLSFKQSEMRLEISDDIHSNPMQEDDQLKSDKNNDEIMQHVYDPPDYDEDKGMHFADQWCALDKISWYPPPDQLWQLRAPYFILPGAKKSGTTSVASYLTQHPLIEEARTKELQSFLNRHFAANFTTEENKTKVKEARELLYTVDYHSEKLKQNHSLMSFDGTPQYLFDGLYMARRILCVTPWIKVIIVLRNPVDRAYSNWAFMNWRLNRQPWTPFEKVVQWDIKLLNSTGVLDAFEEPEEEFVAWAKYRAILNEGCLGRSLYDILLRQWFQAFEEAGRNPRTNFHILRTEDLKRDLQGTMAKVHAFLGLPHVPVFEENELVVSNYSKPMNEETRIFLEKFYHPYTQRLYKLLVEYGFGDDWDGYWDSQKKK